MASTWAPLVVFGATALILIWVKRWITQSLGELSFRWVGDPDVTLVIYFVIVLPGVVVHELSHCLVAKLLGVKVRGLSLGPVRQGRSKRVSLGSIRVGDMDPVRASLIGMAPLVVGLALILLIGYLVLGVGDVMEAVAVQGIDGLLPALDLLARVPDFWLWLYLIFAISNAMLPSQSDMASVRPVLIFLAVATVVLLVVLGVPTITETTITRINIVAGYLATALGLTLVVDIVFVLIIGILLGLTRWRQDAWMRR